MFVEGNLVRCLDTGKVGVIVESKRASFAMMVLVRWSDEEVWTDAADLEEIE